MKHNLLSIALGILVLSLSMPQVIWPSNSEVDPYLIKSVYFYISKSLGAVKGYVIFNDNDGTQRSTSGRLTLSKKKIDYIKESYYIGFKRHERRVPKTTYEPLKNIDFKPGDFQYMELRDGTTIYALPINLRPTDAERGDIIRLKWRDFSIEEEAFRTLL
jgi:hypothetical protein